MDMAAVGESIRNSPEISQAEAKLRQAIDHASSTAILAVKEVTQNLADQVEENILKIKHSIVEGIQEIKSELDVSDLIRRNPWESVVTAAAGGSLLTYLLRSPKILGAAGLVFKKEAAIMQALFFAADLYLRRKKAAVQPTIHH